MTELHFSPEARRAALSAYWDAEMGGRHAALQIDAALDAALAHDAERLARQIIEQRATGAGEMPRVVAEQMVERGLRGNTLPAFGQLADEIQRAYQMGLRALTEP